MISTDDTRIHGLVPRYADDGVEVSYVYPGSLEVRIATGVTMPAATRPQQVVLGMLLADPEEQDPRLWKGDGWTARVIKNEDDEGWAVAMIKDGEPEPALVGPWTMGRDKKNPKPLNTSDFKTLLKGLRQVRNSLACLPQKRSGALTDSV